MPGDKSTFKEHSSFKESDIMPAGMVLVINIAALLAGGLLERVALVPHLVATHHNGLYSWQVNSSKIFFSVGSVYFLHVFDFLKSAHLTFNAAIFLSNI